MSYSYEEQKKDLFTDEGQRMFLKIRDMVKWHLEKSGAVMMSKLFVSGDAWTSLAAVDRMVELGEIIELDYGPCAGQHRVFVKTPSY